MKMLQISEDKFACDVLVPYADIQSSVLNVIPVNNPYGPRYLYKDKNLSGVLLGSSNPMEVQKTWWGCMQSEYQATCGSFWQNIMCDAATIVCPECAAIVIGAWMISCAW